MSIKIQYIAFVSASFFFLSCQNKGYPDKQFLDKKGDTKLTEVQMSKISKNEETEMNSFLENFKTIDLHNLNFLNDSFNIHFLAQDGNLKLVSDSFYSKFCSHIPVNKLAYAYKCQLSDSLHLLVYLSHLGENLKNKVVDTTYFIGSFYDPNLKSEDYIKLVGSNLTGEEPNFNKTSIFEFTNNALVIRSSDYWFNNLDVDVGSYEPVPIKGRINLKTYKIFLDTGKIELCGMKEEACSILTVFPEGRPVILEIVE